MNRNGKYIVWKDGVPCPEYAEPYTRDQVAALQSVALALPYEPLRDPATGDFLPGEERFVGMSNGEVGAIRFVEAHAHGSLDATKYIYDRVLGKPKQQVESLSVSMTYRDFLAKIAADDNHHAAIEQRVTYEISTTEAETVDLLAGL